MADKKDVPAKSMQDMALEPNRLTQVEILDGKVVCKTLGDATTIAMLLWQSGLVPDSVKNEKAAVITVLKGVACGLDPLTAMQFIYVVNNRPTIWGDAGIALVKSHPEYAGMDEVFEGKPGSVDYTAVVTCRRKLRNGGIEEITRKFSIQQAQTAGLMGKDTYKKYPEAMLLWRARSYAIRAVFPDALMGMELTEIAQDEDIRIPHTNPDGSVKPEVTSHPEPERKPKNLADAADTLMRRAKPATTQEPEPEPEQPADEAPAPEPEPEPEGPSNWDLILEAIDASGISMPQYEAIVKDLGFEDTMPDLLDEKAMRTITLAIVKAGK